MRYIYNIKAGLFLVRENDISLDRWSVGTAHLRTGEQNCKRASFWSRAPAQARNRKPEPVPSPSFIFEAQFRPESQIYRLSWSMCHCGVTKNVVCLCSCRFKVHITPKIAAILTKTLALNKHKFALLVNDNTAECNVSQKKKLSPSHPCWGYTHERKYLG